MLIPIIIILFFIFIISILFLLLFNKINNNNHNINNNNINNNDNNNNINNNNDNMNNDINNNMNNPNLSNLLLMKMNNDMKNYDLNKIYNPLVGPTKRASDSLLYVDKLIDSQNWSDNYQLIGTLSIKCIKCKSDEKNNIIKLFGRKKYLSSNAYEYYVELDDGIKLQLKPKHTKELYNNDVVYIKQLQQHYIVSLYDNDEIKYNPDIIIY